ncbi:carbon-nitrogen hydrolase family protein [Agrococcus casei]|uniref:Plant-induced nitrilase, hydrolyses beta-cyano-L-alanine n=1 Tax=Agrococcus casei LMG 22410 TaxID=1255656 RepID=A0A1R4G8F1_9MICO|nr:carbon-nitrogen hydrolase family protein [Agrococcus casei]SJM64474.1 Plant-induced nitrilase, hydrolyses beta-cyano-L-alanine [Agrococcus casei LMG 22410]
MSRVAVVQAASVPFDADAATSKAVSLVAKAAAGGAELAVFPEAFIGGYPKGTSFGAVIGVRTEAGREEYRRYFDGAVTLEGDEVRRLVEASAEHRIHLVVGIIERLGNTLYCTALLISPDEGLVGNHRKLMPTGSERLVWGFGDGSTLDTMDTPMGRVGSVICWENYMPLMRQAMYAKGVELYCAPTADDRPTWQATMTHIALEGRTFVLSACQYLTRDAFPEDHPIEQEMPGGDVLMRGGSVIIDPTGTVLAGPVFDEETILYAEIDLDVKKRSHLDFDPVGHYSRPDVFQLKVNDAPADSVSFGG